MRWHKRTKVQPKVGDTRTKRHFLVFPKSIRGERRWLEFATWVDERQSGGGGWEDGPSYWWGAIKWVNE